MSRPRQNSQEKYFDEMISAHRAPLIKLHAEKHDNGSVLGGSLVHPIYLREGYWGWPTTWILFGPFDIRGGIRRYQFNLCHVKGEPGGPRVKVGCRYYTLPQAWAHWSSRKYTGSRRTGQQALLIIKLMVLQAQILGLLKSDVKFDASICKPKKRISK